MDWCRNNYGKEYTPNTRETFRRQTMHQFVDAGITLYNPDQPDRPVNSPKACYQISPEVFNGILTFGADKWEEALAKHLSQKETLIQTEQQWGVTLLKYHGKQKFGYLKLQHI